MKKLPAILLSVISPLHLFAQSHQEIMHTEAIEFIANMPTGLQDRQNDAIREAMTGDFSALNEVRNARNQKPETPHGVKVSDLSDNYRLYIRDEASDTLQGRGLLIYLHGGGWCFGSINSCASFCSALAEASGIAILAVDYPLAPEQPYPTALNYCIEALKYATDHAAELGIDPRRISVGGDSAGGNLALATALGIAYMHEQHQMKGSVSSLPTINALVLFYPVVKAWNDNSESWKMYETGYGLDGKIMETFNDAYVGNHDPLTPLISPYTASERHLASLPPTLIINADKDILKDQGEDMYLKMKAAGADIHREVFYGTTHLFITVKGQPSAFDRAVSITKDFILSRTDI